MGKKKKNRGNFSKESSVKFKLVHRPADRDDIQSGNEDDIHYYQQDREFIPVLEKLADLNRPSTNNNNRPLPISSQYIEVSEPVLNIPKVQSSITKKKTNLPIEYDYEQHLRPIGSGIYYSSEQPRQADVLRQQNILIDENEVEKKYSKIPEEKLPIIAKPISSTQFTDDDNSFLHRVWGAATNFDDNNKPNGEDEEVYSMPDDFIKYAMQEPDELPLEELFEKKGKLPKEKQHHLVPDDNDDDDVPSAPSREMELLNAQFEAVLAQYENDEEDDENEEESYGIDNDNEDGLIDVEDVTEILDQFLVEQKLTTNLHTIQDNEKQSQNQEVTVIPLIIHEEEDSEIDDDALLMEMFPPRHDPETDVTHRGPSMINKSSSRIANIPNVIQPIASKKVKLHPKLNVPIDGLPSGYHEPKSTQRSAVATSGEKNIHVPFSKPKNENKEDKKVRKAKIKEHNRSRRVEKKETREMFRTSITQLQKQQAKQNEALHRSNVPL